MKMLRILMIAIFAISCMATTEKANAKEIVKEVREEEVVLLEPAVCYPENEELLEPAVLYYEDIQLLEPAVLYYEDVQLLEPAEITYGKL